MCVLVAKYSLQRRDVSCSMLTSVVQLDRWSGSTRRRNGLLGTKIKQAAAEYRTHPAKPAKNTACAAANTSALHELCAWSQRYAPSLPYQCQTSRPRHADSPSSGTLGASHQRAQMAELSVAEGVEVSPPAGVVLSQRGVGSAVAMLDHGCNSRLEDCHRLWKVRWRRRQKETRGHETTQVMCCRGLHLLRWKTPLSLRRTLQQCVCRPISYLLGVNAHPNSYPLGLKLFMWSHHWRQSLNTNML